MDDDLVAAALREVAAALRALGNGDAATSMGAVENLAKEIKDGSTRVADALGEIAEAIRDRP